MDCGVQGTGLSLSLKKLILCLQMVSLVHLSGVFFTVHIDLSTLMSAIYMISCLCHIIRGDPDPPGPLLL